MFSAASQKPSDNLWCSQETAQPLFPRQQEMQQPDKGRKKMILLRDWLDLSLNRSVPSSLLILSRAFTVSGTMKPEEAVVATLSSLPDEVVDTVGTVLPSEDSVSERKRKLEFLEMQEELIKEEEKKQEKEDKAKLEEPEATGEDLALKEMTEPTAREEEELTKSKEHDKKEHLCNISQALAVLASASSVTKEHQEFLSLVNKEIELYNTMLEKEGTEDEEEARRAYKAAREESDHAAEIVAQEKVSSALIERQVRISIAIVRGHYLEMKKTHSCRSSRDGFLALVVQ